MRQPVQALRMFIHSIEKQDLDEKTSKILNNIDILSNNLSNLIDNLLDISKLDYYENKYDFYNFNIKDALYLMLEEFKLISEAKGIKFILNIENIELFSDEILIERMLRNLLTNAFKFTKDEVVISISKERDSVVFSIKDNGIGISDEDKKLIFEEFFQSKNINKDKKDGVGLGLPIVKKICEIIKAKIDIISTFDKGTEFIISIEA